MGRSAQVGCAPGRMRGQRGLVSCRRAERSESKDPRQPSSDSIGSEAQFKYCGRCIRAENPPHLPLESCELCRPSSAAGAAGEAVESCSLGTLSSTAPGMHSMGSFAYRRPRVAPKRRGRCIEARVALHLPLGITGTPVDHRGVSHRDTGSLEGAWGNPTVRSLERMRERFDGVWSVELRRVDVVGGTAIAPRHAVRALVRARLLAPHAGPQLTQHDSV